MASEILRLQSIPTLFQPSIHPSIVIIAANQFPLSARPQLGKKRVKAIARALRNLDSASSSPRTPFANRLTPIGDALHHIRSHSPSSPAVHRHGAPAVEPNPNAPHNQPGNLERTPLNGSEDTAGGSTYGSCAQNSGTGTGAGEGDHGGGGGGDVGKSRDRDQTLHDGSMQDYELPDPALSIDDSDHGDHERESTGDTDSIKIIKATHPAERQVSQGSQHSPVVRDFLLPSSTRARSVHGRVTVEARLRRAPAGHDSKEIEQAYSELEKREDEFRGFLDAELAKIEEFYSQKEKEATEKLTLLKEQLRVMKATGKKKRSYPPAKDLAEGTDTAESAEDTEKKSFWKRSASILAPVVPRSLRRMSSRAATPEGDPQGRSDFTRREPEIPYKAAKRSLKFAMIEYYRGLDLLKAYIDLNHTAFRKINKKHDKVTHARPPFYYLTHHVDKSSFVQSEVIDSHAAVMEDLFSRYVEGGNRKVAVRKLRGKTSRFVDYSSTTFRNGAMFSAGAALGIQGLVNGLKILFDSDGALHVQTSYILQVWRFVCIPMRVPVGCLSLSSASHLTGCDSYTGVTL